ncbi:MAG: hypothetical protein ACOCUF_02400 [Patescibacteria group bacterium]
MKKNINLKSDYEASREKKRKSPLSSVLSIVIILLVLAAYGAVYFLNSQAEEETNNLDSKITEAREQLESEDIKDFYNFENKQNFIKKEVEKFGYNKTAGALIKISENALPEIEVEELRLNKEGDFLKCQIAVRASEKEQIAKQLKAYKDVEKISKADTGGVDLQDNYYHTTITFNLH